MLLYLWNFFRGYLVITVTGFSCERFISLAVRNNIYFWDIHSKGAGMELKVSVRGFKALKPYWRKTGCKIKIKKRKGLPFIIHKYRKRKLLLGGLIFFVASLYFLTSFVWLVEIDGANRVSQSDIMSFCAEYGLAVGKMKYNMDTKSLESKLLDRFKDIAWVNISIKGTRAKIILSEILEKPEVKAVQKSDPCDIVARKDSLIQSIAVISGTPLVKSGDVVRQGDKLVSGELMIQNEQGGFSSAYVHAEALIFANSYYTMEFTVPFEYEEKKYTGNVKKHYYFSLFDVKIDILGFLDKPRYKNYTKQVQYDQANLGEDYPIPLVKAVNVYREFTSVLNRRSVEQAKEEAERSITARIFREFDFSVDVIDKQITYETSENGLKVHCLLTTIERIDVEAEMVINNPEIINSN